jgi:hypothetical protein
MLTCDAATLEIIDIVSPADKVKDDGFNSLVVEASVEPAGAAAVAPVVSTQTAALG